MSDAVELVTPSGQLEGWTRVSVVRSIEQPSLATGFSLGMSELHPSNPLHREIRRGDPCSVRIGGESVVEGYLQRVSPSYSGGDHAIDVAGWDAPADLVACSVIGNPHVPASLEAIAAELCEPFGIGISVEVDTGAVFDRVNIEPGARVGQVLQQLASYRGVVFVPDGRGGLRLTLPGLERAGVELLRGVNIREAARTDDDAERFSPLILEAQRSGGWAGEASGAPISVQVTDPGVTRYRPLVKISDEPPSSRGALEANAQRQVNLRLARSQRVSVSVTGWRIKGDVGSLWRPGDSVPLRDDWLGIDSELVISSVRLEESEQGRTTTLDLVPAMSFDLRPIPEPAAKGPEFW